VTLLCPNIATGGKKKGGKSHAPLVSLPLVTKTKEGGKKREGKGKSGGYYTSTNERRKRVPGPQSAGFYGGNFSWKERKKKKEK